MLPFPEISEWLKQQPLSILQLDAADRIVLFIADERDAIQKKTFTKWVNKHLIKVTKGVVDLFEDLRDGRNLISLLEVLSGEILPRERGRMRVHMLQNVQIALNFLKHRRIKLVNIRAEDIVDGNPKLTLGLIWTIILHFQLSDIVQHDDTLSFREALLRWAQKTTEGYPGVKVTDFTQSWRDGLAFNAILHRNRPDLLDYRACRGKTARENLENAFNIAEKDLGVTRLLDPEDVDTPQPDEKSLITYISSLYELFPEPPEHNPLLDQERIRRIDDYKELANRLNVWMRESIAKLRDRHFPNTLQELKIVQQENNRFRTEEIPPKLHDKQRLASSYKEVLKMSRSLAGVNIEEDYKIENIEQQWNKLITSHQERDHAISEEISRLEKLHRLAEKLLRDIKQCDTNLDDLERKIEEEEKRVQRLNPLDAKFNIDQIESELKQEEERIKGMFKDVQTLRDGRYHKATELHNRVQQLHQRWSNMKLDFQTKVVQVLADRRAQALKKPLTEEELIKSNPSFKFLHDCIQWVADRLKKLDELDYGHDLQSVKALIEQYRSEHRTIEQFQGKVDQCDSKRNQFQGEEYEIYVRMLNRLHKSYSELLVLSNKRLSDLDTLLDFVQAATNEVKWLSEKEEIEVSRDWSSKSINLVELEQHHRQLIVDLERREHQFNSVQDRGESLIRQRHPATKCIEGLMAKMQSQWSWLLQLINCLEDHLKHTADNHQFYNESRECDQWLSRTEEKLNTTYSKQNFSIEEGEHLLKEMNNLKDDITKFGQIVSQLVSKSKDILPLKQRKAPLPRPIKVRALCMVKHGTATVTKNEQVTLHDNSQKTKWRVVTSSGVELNVPGVCFIIPPPDQEAIDTSNELKKKYEALVSLWARKHHKLRQNMIFATLKIVKGWDYKTYCSMDPNQRNAIIKALEDDIDKIVREGPRDDPGSRRLQEEMDALKKKFAEFDARLRAEQDEKSLQALTKKFSDVASPLLDRLTEKERILVQRAHNQIPRDRDSLESLVIEHKEFESDLHSYEPQIQAMKNLLRDIPSRSAAVQGKHDSIIELWNRIQTLSQLYVERLKAVEIALIDIETASKLVSNVELRLASVDDMPADEVALRRIHSELVDIQSDIQRNNTAFDQLVNDVTKVRRVVEKTRPKQATHSDVTRLEDEVKNMTRRWENCANQLIERLRSAEACGELLHSYKTRMDSERSWLSQMTAKVNTLVTRRELDLATKLYEQLAERKPSIEDTNASGGRFIREAKIYDLKLKNYREGLEDSHPSLDASAKRARRTPGADIVAQELDQMNKEYAALIDAVHQSLNQLQDDEAKLQEKRLITKLSFKTYHSDLGLMVSQSPELMDSDNNNTITSNNYQQLTASDATLNKAVYNSNIKTYQTTTILLKSSNEKESVTKRYITTGQLKQMSDETKQLNVEGMLDETVVKLPTNKSQALTFTEIKSVKRHKSESTGTSTDDKLSNKREISSSTSPPSPKKAISPSDVVKASMKSKKISNNVETQISLRPKSGDLANETLFLIKESSVIGKDSSPQSQEFSEQEFSEYSEAKDDRESTQSVITSESNLRDIINKINKSGVKTKMSFKTDQTQSDSSFKESMTNYQSIIKGKSSKSYQITKESNVESWTISGSDTQLKTSQKSSKFDHIDVDSELQQSGESKSKKYIKETVSHIPRKSIPEKTLKQSDSKEIASQKLRTSLRDEFAEEDENLTVSRKSDTRLKTQQKSLKFDNIEVEREIHQIVESESKKIIKDSAILSKKTFKSSQIQGESALKESVTNYESVQTGKSSKRYQSIKQSQLQTDLSGVISSETHPNIETVITSKGKAILKTSRAVQQSTEHEIKSGELNISTGEFVISSTGEKISISEAMTRNLLQSQEISFDNETGVQKYTISGAFNELFDKESNKFKDPQTEELLSFDDLVNKGYVDMNALIYDTVEGTSMSTEEAIREGIINLKTGNVIDSRTKQEISITEATKSGLIAVLSDRSPIISESSFIGADSNATTIPLIKSGKEQVSDDTANEELSNKRETSCSTSPSSPKKSISPSDVVKASMKSKKVSNNVETEIILRPKSGDLENETLIHIKDSSVIGKDSSPQSQQFSEQEFSEYSEAENDRELSQSVKTSESNLRDINKKNNFSHIPRKSIPEKTLKQSDPKEIASQKHRTSLCDEFAEEDENLTVSRKSDTRLKTRQKSSKLDNIEVEREIHKTFESDSKKFIKESTILSKKSFKSSQIEGESALKETVTSSAVQQLTAKEIKSGELNLSTGEFVISSTGEKISISEAMTRNLLQSQEISFDNETGVQKYTISGAFNELFDKESNKFKDPQTEELLSFDDLVNKGYVDMNALIYDTVEGTSMSTEEAIREGIINLKTGNVIDSRTKQEISITEATKSGLIAVLSDRSPIISESSFISADSDATTAPITKPGKEKVSTYATVDEELSNKRETSGSTSPPSPKKSISPSDVVKASMKSEKVSNNVETEISLRPKSSDLANETLIHIKDSSVIGKDSSQQFSEQEYSKVKNDNELAQSGETSELISESNLTDVTNQSGVESKLSFKTDQTQSYNLNETVTNNESIIKGKSSKRSKPLKQSPFQTNLSDVISSETDPSIEAIESSSESDSEEVASLVSEKLNAELVPKQKDSHERTIMTVEPPFTDSKLSEPKSESSPSDTTQNKREANKSGSKSPPSPKRAISPSNVAKDITKLPASQITRDTKPDDTSIKRDDLKEASFKQEDSKEPISQLTVSEKHVEPDLDEPIFQIATKVMTEKSPKRDDLPQSSIKRSKSPPKTLKPISEPGFEVHIGNAQTIPSPEKVLIKKLSRRSITPNKALEEGLLDNETANILNSLPHSVSLDDAISRNVIDGDRGMIMNPQSGEKVSLSKALDLGIIDNDSKSLILPIGRSLSLPSIIERALYNPREKKIIHPETGQLLTLTEAISCDIVDKHSKLIEPKTKKTISLENAINKGIVDALTCDITSASERKMSLVEAVKTNYITLPTSIPAKSGAESLIPEIALTEKAALESGLINADTKQFTHPIKKDVMSVDEAFAKGYLFDISKYEDTIVPSEVPSIEEQQRRQSSRSNAFAKDKDSDKMKSDSKQSIDDKKPTIDRELSIYSPLSAQKADEKSITEKNDENLVLNIDAKTQSQISSSIVKTTMETVITTKGEVILKTSSAVQTMAQEIKSGELNLSTGEFVISSTGEKISISEAMKRNLLQSQEISLLDRQTGVHKYTISGAFNWLFNKESNKFKDPQTGELLSFDDLVNKGYVDMNALIYDTIEGTSMSTEEAIREGVIDLKTGNVTDSRTKQEISITEATKTGLIAVLCSRSPITSESAVSGAISNAMTSSITKSGKVSVSTEAMSPIPKKRTASIKSQTEMRGEEISTTTTVTTSKLRPYTEAAIMEKFHLCEDGIKELNAWLSDVEQRLANLGPVRERDEEVRKQISIVEEIIRDLESHQRQVVTTLDYSHVIAQQGADFMNPEDISRVQKSADALRRRYDLACDHSERLLRRLGASFEELKKFRTELSTFNTWLNNAQKTLSDKEKALRAFKDQNDTFREFTNDVIAHQADLRFISIALQRFIDETKDYLLSLNEFRSSLPRRLNNIESSESQFKSEVQKASDEYYKLLDRVNALNDRLSGLGDKQRNFEDSFDRASRWLSDTKKNVKRVMDEKVGTEPREIQDHLDRVKSLSIEVASGARLVDNVKQSGRTLIESLEQLGVSPSEIKGIEDRIRQLESDYNNLKNSLNDKTSQLQTALAQAQDAKERERNKLLQTGRFQEALTAFEKWLAETEEMVANQKPPSADYNVVKAQLQEQKFLKKLLLDRQNSMSSLANMGKELMKNLDFNEKSQVERKLNDLMRRFDTLNIGCDERMAALERTLPVARAFAEKIGPLQDWLENSERKLDSMMTIPTDQDRIRKRIAEHRNLHNDIIGHKRDFEELTEIAQNLMSLVGDDEAQVVVDRLQEVTDRYAKLVEDSVALGQRLNESHEEIATFVLGFEDLLAWIDEMTSRLNRFRTLSIYVDKLREQLDELTEISEEIVAHRKKISDVVNSGQEIMKHASGDDATFIKSKLDQLQVKFSELTHKASDKLRQAQDALPIAEQFHSAHNKLNGWMDDAERALKQMDSLSLSQQESTIQRLEAQVPENRVLLETVSNLGPQLGHISPGQGAATVEGFVLKATRRFDAICSQIQRKAERIELTKQRNNEVIGDIDELFDWFRDAERQLLEAEPITPNPEQLAILLKETKSLNDDINSQKGRVRDILTNAKKVMRDSSSDDLANIRAKADDLKELANHVSQLCHDRLSALEQALPLAEHFFEAHAELSQWLDEAENEVRMLGKPAINASQIIKQQQITKALIQSVADHKPLLDRLNKTGAALLKLIPEDEGRKIRNIIDSDNNRYNALRNILREQQNALEAALQATSQFVDKLDGMLNALNNTADQLKNAEPIAAHPERIQEQIADNNAILNDLDKRADALEAVRHAAKDVILKAGKSDEPAIRDIKNKLNKLNDLWDHVQKSAKGRGKSLDDALKVAKRFWDELNNVMKALKDIQDNLNNQEPPASEPTAIQQQQDTLQDIKQDIDHTKPEVDHVKKTGKNLLDLCGEPDKPEVKKHIDDLDNAWDNVTSLFAKREKNLIDAMEKAMNFHETLQNLLEFLDYAEDKLANMGPIAADIEAIKGQIRDLKSFKAEVDPHMIEVEALNRQAHELLESVSPNQARAIREPLNEINRRWDDLLKGIVDRHSELENALLKLGQFQHALNEFLAWIQKTERTLDEMRPVFGDPQVIEVELAKHKVLMNDIHAHQNIVDTLNRAGKQLMDSEKGTENARATQRKLTDLNSRWQALQDKANQRQKELEDALKEAQAFNHEIQDLLMWLNDVDGQLAASKPVGGLPETAREQLNRFMELFSELEANRPKVENVLKQGQDYLKRSTEGAATNLQHNLKTLKQRWDNVLSRANDRKIKLEIALREATEFHEALQAFVDWLTSSEKYLSNLQPVSRVLDRVLKQIEEHKQFQKDISDHRETMLNLDKKGTHLKYFSQKQDVILIKNLLVSVQHRWEKVVSKAAERTRALDHGHKEAKEFQDAWSDLISWLDDAEKQFASLQQAGNEPDRIKQLLSRHKEFQRALGAKQATYDATMKLGRALKEKAPKPDHSILQDMLDELKNKWNSVCNKSVDRQRKLEEALLYSGQFKDAVQALIDWLDKAKQQLAIDKPVHGDLDTVTALVDQHKSFQEDLKSRAKNLSSVRKTASELLQTASHEDAQHIKEQISILNSKWDEVERLTEQKTRKLEDALRQAEQLHKAVHMLLEWLSDAEMKLRFAGPLPEDEATTRQHIAEHERFMSEMKLQEKNKDSTISLAKEILEKCHPDAIPVIRHWITIIQSRWEEVSAWAKQREQRLQDHLRSLRDIMELLEELLAWLIGAEASLLAAEAQPLPDDIITLENLIEEHQRFIDDMNRKEPDVDRVIKAFSSKRQVTTQSQPAKGREYDSRRRGVPPRTSTPIRGVEPEIKHPRARELMEKWRIVWKLAMERMKRLQDKLNYNRELDRMRNFDFDEWRRRFLAWMNNKKARIMDFFRKIDKDNDGKVTKADFIDGFLASKFPTSRLEMEKVADVFDRNNDGYIDHKEYLDTLRPDRDGQPKTESEIIQDEVQRQVAKCTCLVRYKVFQVGEGKYRFGESQKLRLVRILRSTVMVRVGGGWVSLDEFLLKNDPCRAKGRTNVELREQFILAEGVSQSMTPFKSKSPIKPDGSIQTTGPITKIREKSERSVPMTHQHHHRYGNQTSDYSFSDQADTSGAKSRPRSRLTVGSNGSRPSSRPNSRPGSRQSSRPPSRAGSDLSTESLEDYQQRKVTTTRTKYGLTSSVKRTPSIGRTTAPNGSATRDRWK